VRPDAKAADILEGPPLAVGLLAQEPRDVRVKGVRVAPSGAAESHPGMIAATRLANAEGGG
jgi:hypothetical protein